MSSARKLRTKLLPWWCQSNFRSRHEWDFVSWPIRWFSKLVPLLLARPAQAEVGQDLELFQRMLPHLRFLLDFTERSGFKDPIPWDTHVELQSLERVTELPCQLWKLQVEESQRFSFQIRMSAFRAYFRKVKFTSQLQRISPVTWTYSEVLAVVDFKYQIPFTHRYLQKTDIESISGTFRIFAIAIVWEFMSCDLHRMDPSAGARQAQCGGARGVAPHCSDVGARGGQWSRGAGESMCPKHGGMAAVQRDLRRKQRCPVGASHGVRGPFLWGPARRPSTAISKAGRSAILAPRCQAAGGGESLVISSLGDFGGFIHGTLKTVIPSLVDIGGMIWKWILNDYALSIRTQTESCVHNSGIVSN